MFKRITLICLALFSVVAIQAQERAEMPSVDEILANFFENTGGEEAWENLKTMKMNGNMSMQGMEFPGTIYMAHPNKQRVEVNIQGQELIQAYDGETAWWINPFMGGTDAQEMPAEMAEDMTKEEFEDDFMNYEEKGHKVELVGMEEVEGAECYALKLTKENGDEKTTFFDAEYFVPIMERSTVENGPMAGQVSETFMSDYQEVDGLMIPYFIETKMGGQTLQKISITNIELNVEMDEEMFAFPKTEDAVDDK